MRCSHPVHTGRKLVTSIDPAPAGLYRDVRQASLIDVMFISRYIPNRFALGTPDSYRVELTLLAYLHEKDL